MIHGNPVEAAIIAPERPFIDARASCDHPPVGVEIKNFALIRLVQAVISICNAGIALPTCGCSLQEIGHRTSTFRQQKQRATSLAFRSQGKKEQKPEDQCPPDRWYAICHVPISRFCSCWHHVLSHFLPIRCTTAIPFDSSRIKYTNKKYVYPFPTAEKRGDENCTASQSERKVQNLDYSSAL